MCRFIEGFYAIGADSRSLAINIGPLEVGVSLGLGGWIIMTAKQNSRCGHYWFFPASRTLGSHM